MEEERFTRLTRNEELLLAKINKTLGWEFPESELLAYTFVSIKLQGGAFKLNVMELASLGIPIFAMLGASRCQSTSEVIQHLKTGSINFYEITNVLTEFAKG